MTKGEQAPHGVAVENSGHGMPVDDLCQRLSLAERAR